MRAGKAVKQKRRLFWRIGSAESVDLRQRLLQCHGNDLGLIPLAVTADQQLWLHQSAIFGKVCLKPDRRSGRNRSEGGFLGSVLCVKNQIQVRFLLFAWAYLTCR